MPELPVPIGAHVVRHCSGNAINQVRATTLPLVLKSGHRDARFTEIFWAGLSDNSAIWSAKVCDRGLLIATQAMWYTLFVDPNSMVGAEDIEAHGEVGTVKSLLLGPPGAWFYPAKR